MTLLRQSLHLWQAEDSGRLDAICCVHSTDGIRSLDCLLKLPAARSFNFSLKSRESSPTFFLTKLMVCANLHMIFQTDGVIDVTCSMMLHFQEVDYIRF